MKPPDLNDLARAGLLPDDLSTGLRPAPLPRARVAAVPPAAPTLDTGEPAPVTQPTPTPQPTSATTSTVHRASAGDVSPELDTDEHTDTMPPINSTEASEFSYLSAVDLAADLDLTDRRVAGTDKPIPVRFSDVAEQLGGGLWPGLHVLVGGSGVGKTALALDIALTAAMAGHPVGYVGLELEPRQVRLRLLATLADVPWPSLVLGRGEGAAAHIEQARRVAPALARVPIMVECARPEGWHASRLEPMAEALRGKSDLAPLLVVDFLQLLGSAPGKREDIRERIGGAAYTARHIAKDYGAAVLAVSSTSREKYADLSVDWQGKNGKGDPHAAGFRVSEKGNRYMLNRDALIGMGKESGEVEYAADSVSVLVRYRDSREANGAGAVIFASPKVRAGAEGWCELGFDGTRFSPGAGLAAAAAFEASKPAPAKVSKARGKRPPASVDENDEGEPVPPGWEP